MKALLTRFGGIGDTFPVAVAATELNKRGYDVTVALRDDGKETKQSILFQNIPNFKVIDYKEFGPWHTRCFETDSGWLQERCFFNRYDFVVDFVNIVENNSTTSLQSKEPWDCWQRSRSSNYRNWYDLHLEWCNIDPTKVSDEDKRPFLIPEPKELDAANEFKKNYSKLFVVHPYASSLARSWYQAEQLIDMLLSHYKGCAVAFWNPRRNAWDLFAGKERRTIPKLASNPLRESIALISVADLVVTVDTGCGHMAEALNRKSLVLYSTVPAWTRNKYYKHQEYIDLGEKDPRYYTFSLGLGDPLNIKEGMDSLSEREKKVLDMYENSVSVEEVMAALNTDEEGAELELKLVMGKMQSFERRQSQALSKIEPKMVFKRIKEIIHE